MRSLTLPNSVAPTRIHAAYSGGLHDVTPPPREEAQPKTTNTQ